MKKELLSALLAAALMLSGCGSTDTGDAALPWGKDDSSSQSSAATQTTKATSATTGSTTAKVTTAAPSTTAAATVTTASVTTKEETTVNTVTVSEQPSGESVPDKTPRFKEYKEAVLSASLKGSYTPMDNIDYYYCNIDDFHKFIYAAMYDVCIHAGQKDYRAYLRIPESLIWDFSDDFYMTFACLMDDYPEFYYFDEQAGLSWDYAEDKYNSGYYRVYIYQRKDFPEFEKEQKELRAAANAFLSDIDLSGSEYDVALRVHDKLLDTVVFDDSEKQDDPENEFQHVQTAYGALINHKAVCEGYADALSYLLRWCGIMCLPIEGGAGSGETYEEALTNASEGLHAWNLMRLDGKYSETDPSWDDFSEEDYSEYTLSLIYDVPGLIDKARHIYWNISIPEMRDLQRRDEFIYYTDTDGETYSLAHGCAVHLRSSDPRCAYYSNSGSYNYRALAEMLPQS